MTAYLVNGIIIGALAVQGIFSIRGCGKKRTENKLGTLDHFLFPPGSGIRCRKKDCSSLDTDDSRFCLPEEART